MACWARDNLHGKKPWIRFEVTSGLARDSEHQIPIRTRQKILGSSQAQAWHPSSMAAATLAIIAWVGTLGILPFIFLLAYLVKRIVSALVWISRTVNPNHPVVPLAMVLLAGLIHAGFEDWLFAPGYYLCTFYWCMAFIFVDQTAFLSNPQSRAVLVNRARPERQELFVVAPGR